MCLAPVWRSPSTRGKQGMRTGTWIGLLLGLGCALPASADYTMGPTPDCDVVVTPQEDPLELGLPYGELRIVAGEYDVGSHHYNPTEFGLRIQGGFASCADARNDVMPAAGSRTILRQATAEPMLRLVEFNNLPAGPVEFRNLEFVGRFYAYEEPTAATGGLVLRGWGGPEAPTFRALIVDSVFTDFDTLAEGGALHVFHVHLTLLRTTINNSRGRLGGGMYCRRAQVDIGPDTHFIANDARNPAQPNQANGGAMALVDCDVTIRSRGIGPAGTGGSGISENRASGRGAAIHAAYSAIHIIGGDDCGGHGNCIASPVRFFENQSLREGGAFFLRDETTLTANGVEMSNNTGSHGGAIAVRNESVVVIGDLDASGRRGCLDQGFCQVFSQNHAYGDEAGAGMGGAINAVRSDVHLNNTLLRDNLAGFGNAGYIQDDARLWMVQSILSQTQTSSELFGQLSLVLSGNSVSQIRHSTLDSAIADTSVLALTGQAQLLMEATAVRSRSGADSVRVAQAAYAIARCNALGGNVVDPNGSISGTPIGNADFDVQMPWLPRSGAMVDRCIPTLTDVPPHDILGRPRLVQLHAGMAANPMDVGALELQPEIFSDGLEWIPPN